MVIYISAGISKVTVNEVLDIDQNPLPNPDDLFATLAGRKMFPKLDLSQAYLQLILDKESANFIIINSHKGLYWNAILNSVWSVDSPGNLFQKVMNSILQGPLRILCCNNDILNTGEDDVEHVQNLEK